MGYRREPKLYRLRFEDPSMEGFECLCRSVSIERFMALTGLAGGTDLARQAEGAMEMFGIFAEALVSWNLEDEDGEKVPATLEGVRAQDLDFMLPIIVAWQEAIAAVAPPLPSSSNGGATSLERSIPMAPLSPSLQS